MYQKIGDRIAVSSPGKLNKSFINNDSNFLFRGSL